MVAMEERDTNEVRGAIIRRALDERSLEMAAAAAVSKKSRWRGRVVGAVKGPP